MKKQKLFQQILMKRKQPVKQKVYIFYFHFYQLVLYYLIAISIYCYQIKYRAKQKHLLQFHGTNNKLKEVLYQ